MKRKWMRIGFPIVAVLAVLTGAALAAGTAVPGSSEDPLITLSYLNEVFTGKLTETYRSELDSETAALREELETRIAALEEKSAELDGNGTTGSARYSLVTMSDGQKLTGERGTELLLRIGSCTVVASDSPGLVDTTTGDGLDNGKSLAKNHLYMVTIPGHGVKASGTVKIIVRGEYTIS